MSDALYTGSQMAIALGLGAVAGILVDEGLRALWRWFWGQDGGF